MKRVLCLLLSAVMALALIGCDSSSSSSSAVVDSSVSLDEEISQKANELEKKYDEADSILDFFKVKEDADTYVSMNDGVIYVKSWYDSIDSKDKLEKISSWDKIKENISSSRESSIELAGMYGYTGFKVVYQFVNVSDHSDVFFEVDENGDATDYTT